ncbi:hypothetical protein [Plebeiibacterium sediminum]|uniref:Peptidase S74 domain-containing protein n=1 Tax=Plebeiibacterium sediminum TaxID=2992112 RepID=A0AAE3M8J9_9BACT|nr:hypothetical protein [Plebeiobacterium sediminum]MCW3789224.1 hypothetical protein [Plebeiobacterium sediminum]
MKRIAFIIFNLIICTLGFSQQYEGYFRTVSGNNTYHHFTRNGGGSVVYINQLDTTHPILRLSSGTSTANERIKFTVENNGFVGIGTSSPTSLLNLQGTPWCGIKIQDVTKTDGRGVKNQYLDGNNDGWAMYFGGHYSNQPLKFAPISKGVQGNASLSLLDNGNVSIGNFSNNTVGRLQIKGDGPDQGVTIWNESGATTFRLWADATTNVGYLSRGNLGTSGIALAVNGNVGIGTAKPTEKLSVNGTILAKEVRVSTESTDWPDYVFSDTYNLKDLSEVEAFIKENNHLPEIPSAEEMEASGVNLAEMNKLLLLKVEELTLYIIEKDKQVEKQQDRYNDLESQLNIIKKTLLNNNIK